MNKRMKMALMNSYRTDEPRDRFDDMERRGGAYETGGTGSMRRNGYDYGGVYGKMGNYQGNAEYDGGMEGRRRMGFSSHYDDGRQQEHRQMHGKVIPMYEEDDEELTMEEAQEWVKHMVGNGPSAYEGARWELHEVKEFAEKLGIPTNEQAFIDFYAVMNAMYSDYTPVAKEFGVHRPEFYAAMAKAWICDIDAVDNKAAAYYRHVVKHDD